MLAEDARDQTADMRGGEAVAGRADRASALPRHVDVDAGRPDLDGRGWIEREPVGIATLVCGDREHRRELRRVARNVDVVDRADEHHVPEVRLVDELVQQREVLPPAAREAHVHDVHVVVDCPPQPGGEDGALALELAAEHANAVELGAGRDRADDARARRAVSEEIAVRTLDDPHAVFGVRSRGPRRPRPPRPPDGPPRSRCR